jgi:hypothetical protein
VDGVTRVSLSKSEASASSAASTTAESPCSGANPATFSLVVFFERSAAMAAWGASGAADAPVPNAVNQANGAAATANGTQSSDGTQPANGSTTPATTDPAGAQPQASNPNSTSVTTSTTAGGTP